LFYLYNNKITCMPQLSNNIQQKLLLEQHSG
jgi:hypothetical protein